MWIPKPNGVTRYGKSRATIKMIETECRDLDEALAIIANRQKKARSAITKAKRTHPTLSQEFARARSRATMLKRNGKISLAGSYAQQRDPRIVRPKKAPHPLKDLSDEDKKLRAQDMWESGRWGFGSKALRDISVAFGVHKGQMAEWLDGITPRL